MISITTDTPPIVYQVDTFLTPTHCTGPVQWNGTTRRFEVNDGTRWIPIDHTVRLKTSSDMEQIIEWAQRRMKEDSKIQKLLETNVALRDAHDKYEVIKKLVLKEQ